MTFDFVPSKEVSRIRARLAHPIIDADGHLVEFMPMVIDCMREVADDAVADRFVRFRRSPFTSGGGYLPTRVFFGNPLGLDRMTVMLPKLLYRRLEEIGLDFALLYPTSGLSVLSNPDDELRQAAARALNTYYARVFADYRDRLEPVAIIPTFTPEEAVAELDYAIGTLGLKAVVMSGTVPRTVRPDGSAASWVDTLGHDSLYDYDPLWARCVELGVAPAFHGIGYGWGSRVSAKNYVYNHLGNFAAAQEAACRSLVMGGVPRRHPELRLSFLEGGVMWAANLYADLLGALRQAQQGRRADVRPGAASTSRSQASCSPSSPTARSAATGIASRRAPSRWGTPARRSTASTTSPSRGSAGQRTSWTSSRASSPSDARPTTR